MVQPSQEGTNWELIPQFIDPESASRASEQANLLIEFADEFPFIRSSEYSPPGQQRLFLDKKRSLLNICQ